MSHKSLYICEYIWIGGNGELRSKTKVINNDLSFNNLEDWSYDASSTDQAYSSGDTEGILKPCKIYKNPLKVKYDGFLNYDNWLVLCEAFDKDGFPLKNNYRTEAKKKFNLKLNEIPWFGLEQEYFMLYKDYLEENNIKNKYTHYCGTYTNNLRHIAEEHLFLCLEAGLTISGLNAEVANQQWEFQIGPCEGIDASDELIIARFLLERLAEQYNIKISYFPKLKSDTNGSGCHINFSTQKMRESNGIEYINEAIRKLESKHNEHMLVYGKNNRERLTGEHETSSYDNFSWGIGTRTTSIRIPNHVYKQKCGYFEDRRPASNIDPYQATSTIFETCCL